MKFGVVLIVIHIGTLTLLLSFLLPLLHLVLINAFESLNLTFLHELLNLLLSRLASISLLFTLIPCCLLTRAERLRAIVDQILTQLDILRIRMLLHLLNL